MPTKRCTKCGVERALDQFCKNKNVPDGHHHWCKICTKEHKSKPENKERIRRYNLNYKNIFENKTRAKDLRSRPEMKEKSREYRQRPKTKELQRKQTKKWGQTDKGKEYIKMKSKEYWQDPEYRKKRKEYDKRPDRREKQRERNKRPEHIKRHREYEKTPRGRLLRLRIVNKRRALELKQNPESTLTLSQWNKILELQENICVICGKRFTKKNPPTRDHIIPVFAGGAFVMENTQAVHGPCNSKKGKKIDKTNIVVWLSKPELCVVK